MKNAIVKELTAEKKRLVKALALVEKTLGKFSGVQKKTRKTRVMKAKAEPKSVVVKAKPGPKPGRKSLSAASAGGSGQETLQEIRDRKARLAGEQAARKGGEIGQPV